VDGAVELGREHADMAHARGGVDQGPAGRPASGGARDLGERVRELARLLPVLSTNRCTRAVDVQRVDELLERGHVAHPLLR
jgi:hypothetical protein